jgi:hypothetical protein
MESPIADIRVNPVFPTYKHSNRTVTLHSNKTVDIEDGSMGDKVVWAIADSTTSH